MKRHCSTLRLTAATAEAGVEMEAAREAVDVVSVQCIADLIEVLLRQLLRVVELVAVDQVAEPVDRAPDALRHRLAPHSGW